MSFFADEVATYERVAMEQARPEEKTRYLRDLPLIDELISKTRKNPRGEATSSEEQQLNPGSKLVNSVENALSEIRLATSSEVEGLVSLERVLAAHAEIREAVKLYVKSVAPLLEVSSTAGSFKTALSQGRESGELDARTCNALSGIAEMANTKINRWENEVFSSRGPIVELSDFAQFSQAELLKKRQLGEASLAKALEFFEKRGVVTRP